ncbi:MAG: TonB-dependent receptor [Bacteroidota bacterium]|nr:TonB-dependent receptor [Bacteroidota bacterium]
MKGNYILKFFLFGLITLFFAYTAIANNEDNGIGVISGKIVTSDNEPAEGVTVHLKNEHRNRTAITDENGYFELRGIPKGTYEIAIIFIGHETIRKYVVVNDNVKLSLSFQLKMTERQLSDIEIKNIRQRLSIAKINIPDKDLPLATAIISNEVIHDQQAIRLGDIVKNAPGVSLVQTRYGVNETYGARGYIIGINGGAGGGSIFKNGLPYNIAGMPETASLESVEIIKGSSAFLYGSSSSGLIIDMITKKPQFNWGGSVSFLMGSNQQYKPVLDLYGPLSKKIAFRVVGSYENDRSYRDVVKTIRNYVNPSLLYKINDKTSLLLSGEYLNAQITPDPGVGLLDSGRVLTNAIPRSRYQNVAWAYNNVLQMGASATFKHVINKQFSLTGMGSFQHTDVNSYGVGNLNTASVNGIIARPLARAHSIETDVAGQVNLEGKFKLKNISNHFLAGVDYTSIITKTDAFAIYNNNGLILKTYDTINLLNPFQYVQRTDIPNAIQLATTTAPSYRAGIYVQDLITVTQQIKLFAGVRYSYQANVQTTIDSTANNNRGAITVKGSAATATYQVLSPKLGIIYQPASNLSFYASYANNFTANTGVDVFGNPLKASIIHQYEVGAKNNFANGKLSATMSVYKIINSNLAQQAIYLADGITPNTNSNIKMLSGETTSDGVELGLNGNFTKNLYFITGFAYNNIQFTHTSGTKGSNIEGEPLVNAPRYTANASVFYTFTNSVLKGFKIGASGFYTGARYGGYNNLVGQTILGSRLIPLSGFTTVDISTGYTYKKISTQAKVSNVFNSLNYLVHDNYSVTPIAPRQLFITISYQL